MNPWVLILAALVVAVGFLIWDQPEDPVDDQDDQQRMREWLEERRRDV